MDLVARKSMTYATRRLQAGDRFAARPANARVLIALRRAAPAPAPIKDRAALRAEYAEVLGKRPFSGWDEATLAAKIAAARAGK